MLVYHLQTNPYHKKDKQPAFTGEKEDLELPDAIAEDDSSVEACLSGVMEFMLPATFTFRA